MAKTAGKLSLAEQTRQGLAAAQQKQQAEFKAQQAAEKKKEEEAEAEEKRVGAEVKRTIAGIFKKEFQPVIDKAISERKNSVKLEIGRASVYARNLNEAIKSLLDNRQKALARHLPDYLSKEGFKATPDFNPQHHEASTDPEYRYDAYDTTDVWVDVSW